MIRVTRIRTAAAAFTIAGGAIAVAALSPTFHALPFIAPDSASYLRGDVGRTAAYPLLVSAIPLSWLGGVQLVAIAVTAAWMAVEAATIVHPLLAIAVEVAILGNAAMMSYAFTVLPEAFFISAVQAQLALGIRLLRRPAAREAVAAGIVSAILVLLKPSGYSFPAAALALLWLTRAHTRIVAPRLIGALVAIVLASAAIGFARTGTFATQAYGGYAAIGYVAHLLDERTPTAFPDLAPTILERIDTSRRELGRIGDVDLYYMASSTAYHDVLDTLRPTILEYVHQHNPELNERQAFVRMNAIAGSLTMSIVTRHPVEYVRHAATHWQGLWLMPLIRNASDHDAFAARLTALAAVAPHTLRYRFTYRELPPVVYWPIKTVLVLALVLSSAGLILNFKRSDATDAAAFAYVAAALHSNFLLVSAVQTGLPRYALAMWPATMLVTALGVSWCWGLAREKMAAGAHAATHRGRGRD